MDLPNSASGFDENYPYGAKIWLVPTSSLNGAILAWGNQAQFLFENWPGLINYKQGDRPNEELNCDYDNPNCTDNDGDGYFVEASGCEDEPGFIGHNDCLDTNSNSWRIDLYYYDGDDDGYKAAGYPNQNAQGQFSICYGEDIPVGYTDVNLPDDCDDNNSDVNPAVAEICNDNIDNDCNGFIDCADLACDVDPSCDGKTTNTITFGDLEAASQYGYYHDYGEAVATFTYTTPSASRLSGLITATGLKPYATYQMKFNGKPTCLPEYTATGDDVLNEIIGYQGRWWNNTTNSNLNWTPAENDAYYLANSTYHGGAECITGYLVWDDITADVFGNVAKVVETANSYHVFWCNDVPCDTTHVNTQLYYPDSNNPLVAFCPSGNVNGEIERFSCNGLTLAPDNYDLQFVLNEESFHQGPGTWTAVMDADIDFVIN